MHLGSAGATVGGMVYVVGGTEKGRVEHSARFDPLHESSWEVLPPAPTARAGCAVAGAVEALLCT
jgi:hypothetical protein